MSINLMYDVSVIGAAMTYNTSKTGVFRVVIGLLKQLEKMEDVEIIFSNTALPQFLKTTKKYLKQNGYQHSFSNDLIYPYPHTFFGRGKRILRKLYNTIGIDNNSIAYDTDLFKKANVFHTPFYKIPQELNKYKDLKRCITVHDLIPILYSELHHKKSELENTLNSIGNDFVICVSENTKNDLLNYNKRLDSDKVFVSYPSADPDYFYPCSDTEKFNKIKVRYGIPDNYYLSLCTLEPRKNLERLIRCFNAVINEQQIDDLYLVLVGSKGWQFDEILAEISHSKMLKNRVIVTGYIPDNDLAALYSNAMAFYYLSLYEGFGLPPLEAMQCGTATVTSNVSSLPEVAGEGAILVNPTDEDQISDVMYELYKDSELRQIYQNNGKARAKKFSWYKTAGEHVEIYKMMIENG